LLSRFQTQSRSEQSTEQNKYKQIGKLLSGSKEEATSKYKNTEQTSRGINQYLLTRGGGSTEDFRRQLGRPEEAEDQSRGGPEEAARQRTRGGGSADQRRRRTRAGADSGPEEAARRRTRGGGSAEDQSSSGPEEAARQRQRTRTAAAARRQQ
jgi:hypothetical protein